MRELKIDELKSVSGGIVTWVTPGGTTIHWIGGPLFQGGTAINHPKPLQA
jgi:hypothetical protein